MSNVNDIALHGSNRSDANAVTLALPQDVADSFRKSPLPMRIIFYSYLVLLFAGVAWFVFASPENAQQYRFYGILAFIGTFPLRAVLKKIFLGRAVTSVSDDMTSRLGQSEEFRNTLRDTLMGTPWSKHRLSKGRDRKPRFENIMVLFKDGSHTTLSIATDFSSISIVPPARTI
jgi:hypothetical protein